MRELFSLVQEKFHIPEETTQTTVGNKGVSLHQKGHQKGISYAPKAM